MVWSAILTALGILALIDSLIVLIFPGWALGFVKKISKNKKALKKVAWIELLIAIVLILIGINV